MTRIAAEILRPLSDDAVKQIADHLDLAADMIRRYAPDPDDDTGMHQSDERRILEDASRALRRTLHIKNQHKEVR